MVVPARYYAVLEGTQSPAVVVAHAAAMAVAAVGQAVVDVAAGLGAVLIRADGDAGLNLLSVSAVTAPSAMMSVGRDGHNQHCRQNSAHCGSEQPTLSLEHGNNFLSVRLGRVIHIL
ncbi:hypothetical protein D1641_09190 [Colidextribacter sp. OB.20]|nr:hypothetical protein [Colidextribacter sp. OB.20]